VEEFIYIKKTFKDRVTGTLETVSLGQQEAVRYYSRDTPQEEQKNLLEDMWNVCQRRTALFPGG